MAASTEATRGTSPGRMNRIPTSEMSQPAKDLANPTFCQPVQGYSSTFILKSRLLGDVPISQLEKANSIEFGEECTILVLPLKSDNENSELLALRDVLKTDAVCLDSQHARVWRVPIDAVSALSKVAEIGFVPVDCCINSISNVHTWTMVSCSSAEPDDEMDHFQQQRQQQPSNGKESDYESQSDGGDDAAGGADDADDASSTQSRNRRSRRLDILRKKKRGGSSPAIAPSEEKEQPKINHNGDIYEFHDDDVDMENQNSGGSQLHANAPVPLVPTGFVVMAPPADGTASAGANAGVNVTKPKKFWEDHAAENSAAPQLRNRRRTFLDTPIKRMKSPSIWRLTNSLKNSARTGLENGSMQLSADRSLLSVTKGGKTLDKRFQRVVECPGNQPTRFIQCTHCKELLTFDIRYVLTSANDHIQSRKCAQNFARLNSK